MPEKGGYSLIIDHKHSYVYVSYIRFDTMIWQSLVLQTLLTGKRDLWGTLTLL